MAFKEYGKWKSFSFSNLLASFVTILIFSLEDLPRGTYVPVPESGTL
jgi:hypothetical protein